MIRIRLFSALALAGVLSSLTATAAMPKVKLERVFTNMNVTHPLWMEEAPDGSGRVFIMEQEGYVQIVKKGTDGASKKEFLKIGGGNLYNPSQNEEGLLGFAFHPKFKENGKFYVYYTRQAPETPGYPVRTVASEFKVSATDPDKADPASERELLVIPRPYWNHEGGCMGFGPDGFLYISSGDGGNYNDPHNNGQNLSVLLGKIMRLDVDHTTPGRRDGIPSDNPFVGEGFVEPEIWSWGMRNPWRFSFDRQTGLLYEGDVGQDKYEEVNIIVKGGNYGWGVREGFHEFRPSPDGAKYIDPIIEYAHSTSLARDSKFPDHGTGLCIIGGYVYRGKKYPSLNGIYIYGDYNLGTIFGLRYENGKLLEYGTMLNQPKNICSFAQDADGEVYMLSLNDGRVYAVVPAAGN